METIAFNYKGVQNRSMYTSALRLRTPLHMEWHTRDCAVRSVWGVFSADDTPIRQQLRFYDF